MIAVELPEQSFNWDELVTVHQDAYEQGLQEGYLEGERDGHDRALRTYVRMFTEECLPRKSWVPGEELRRRFSADDPWRGQYAGH